MTNTIDLLVVRGIKAATNSKLLNIMFQESIGKRQLQYISNPTTILDLSQGIVLIK